MDILLAFVIAFGLLLIAQIIRKIVLRPIVGTRCKVVMTVYADGSGESLEQCVRSAASMAARLCVPLELVDNGLDTCGLQIARVLSQEYGFYFR